MELRAGSQARGGGYDKEDESTKADQDKEAWKGDHGNESWKGEQDKGSWKDEQEGSWKGDHDRPRGGVHTGGGALASPTVTAGGMAVLAVAGTGLYALRRRKSAGSVV